MPLRCVDTAGESVQANLVEPSRWLDIVALARNQRLRLSMPCCGVRALPKTSKKGTQFFAHARKGDCDKAPESEEHLALKALAMAGAALAGWHAESEIRGGEDGDAWVADVLACKGDDKVAIEIQWSPITDVELLERHRRYERHGVRALWLIKREGFMIHESVPAAVAREYEGRFLSFFPRPGPRQHPAFGRNPVELVRDFLSYGAYFGPGMPGEFATFHYEPRTGVCAGCGRDLSWASDVCVDTEDGLVMIGERHMAGDDQSALRKALGLNAIDCTPPSSMRKQQSTLHLHRQVRCTACQAVTSTHLGSAREYRRVLPLAPEVLQLLPGRHWRIVNRVVRQSSFF